MSESGSLVHIHYLRPPDHKTIFTQRLLLDDPTVKITLALAIEPDAPIEISGGVALEPGSSVIWFTFPDLWHDIARFHRADGTFTGCYANILTPPTFHDGGIWRTTDLYLDLWLPADGGVLLLDEDELEEAVAQEWIDTDTADRARREASTLKEKAEAGAWPPPIVEEWTLEKALASL